MKMFFCKLIVLVESNAVLFSFSRKGYVICDLALLDPNKAFQDALELRSFELDQAISQSQVQYFASTMADFDDSNITSTGDSSNGGSTDSAYCADNPGCNALGLTGLCCPPTSGGANLGCCSSASTGTDSASSTATEVSGAETGNDSSCSLHEACDSAGLTGACCPTQAGVRLSCCDA